jgi:Na+/melibiose symporter-like transporter
VTAVAGLAPALSRNTAFLILWFSQALSVGGNALALVALPLLVLDATGSVTQMGALTAVTTVGWLVSGLLAGPVVDRFDRRRLMILTDLVRAGLYGAIPLCWLYRPQVWLLYVVAAVAAVFGMLFQVAYAAALPRLVRRDQLLDANSRLEATFALSYVVGPVCAGVLTAAVGGDGAVGLNALTFLVSAAGLAAIRLRPPEDEPGPAAADRGELLAGFRFLWRSPILRALTLLLSALTFLTLGATDVFIYHLKTDLGQGDSAVGYTLGAAGIGSIAGALLVPYVRRALGFGVAWLGANLLCGLAMGGIGLVSHVPVVAVLAATFSFGMTASAVTSVSLRQQITPDHLLGRVTAVFRTLHSALAPLGALLLTAATGRAGVRAVCLAGGGAVIVFVALGLLTSARSRHPELTEVS